MNFIYRGRTLSREQWLKDDIRLALYSWDYEPDTRHDKISEIPAGLLLCEEPLTGRRFNVFNVATADDVTLSTGDLEDTIRGFIILNRTTGELWANFDQIDPRGPIKKITGQVEKLPISPGAQWPKLVIAWPTPGDDSVIGGIFSPEAFVSMDKAGVAGDKET